MGGVAKVAKKAIKSVGKVIGNSVDFNKKLLDKITHPASTLKKVAGNIMPEMPEAADAPLMPDYDMLEKNRRRSRAKKMGRTETIMSGTFG